MKQLGRLIGILGTLACLIYIPVEAGIWEGYAFVWESQDALVTTEWAVEYINYERLGLQILIVVVVATLVSNFNKIFK